MVNAALGGEVRMATKKAAKKATAKKAPVKAKAARPRATAKYDQPGAPWWKKVPAPPQHG
jgi:hypothetical protein